MVLKARFELARLLKSLDFKSNVSAYSTTSAYTTFTVVASAFLSSVLWFRLTNSLMDAPLNVVAAIYNHYKQRKRHNKNESIKMNPTKE